MVLNLYEKSTNIDYSPSKAHLLESSIWLVPWGILRVVDHEGLALDDPLANPDYQRDPRSLAMYTAYS